MLATSQQKIDIRPNTPIVENSLIFKAQFLDTLTKFEKVADPDDIGPSAAQRLNNRYTDIDPYTSDFPFAIEY